MDESAAAPSEVASKAAVMVFHQDDVLGCILNFLHWKELLHIEVVSTKMRSCANQSWRLLAQTLSLGEEMHSKQGTVSFLQCQELAKNMELLQDTQRSRADMMGEGRYPAYSQIPPALLKVFANPSEHHFFVRISEKQEREGSTTGAFQMNWEGYLPFLIVDEPVAGGRCITCDTHEVMPELVTKLEGIHGALNKGVCANEFVDDELFAYVKTIAMTIVALPRQLEETAHLYRFSEPCFVTSTRCIDLVHGEGGVVDGKILWVLRTQEVSSIRGDGIDVSFRTKNREITELRVALVG
jgi:hypothetical protein